CGNGRAGNLSDVVLQAGPHRVAGPAGYWQPASDAQAHGSIVWTELSLVRCGGGSWDGGGVGFGHSVRAAEHHGPLSGRADLINAVENCDGQVNQTAIGVGPVRQVWNGRRRRSHRPVSGLEGAARGFELHGGYGDRGRDQRSVQLLLASAMDLVG